MIILRWLINALTLLLVSELVPGFSVHSLWTALIAALVIGFLNATVRWVIVFLTLPLNVLTLGFFTFIINALMLWLASSVVKGFDITSFSAAFWAALLLWVISMITSWFLDSAEV